MKRVIKSLLCVALCYAMLFSTVDFSAVRDAILNADFNGDVSSYRTVVEAADSSFKDDTTTNLWKVSDNTAVFKADNSTVYTEAQATQPGNVKWDVLSGIPSTENLYVGVGAYAYNGTVNVKLKSQSNISRTTTLNVITYGNWGANNAYTLACPGHKIQGGQEITLATGSASTSCTASSNDASGSPQDTFSYGGQGQNGSYHCSLCNQDMSWSMTENAGSASHTQTCSGQACEVEGHQHSYSCSVTNATIGVSTTGACHATGSGSSNVEVIHNCKWSLVGKCGDGDRLCATATLTKEGTEAIAEITEAETTGTTTVNPKSAGYTVDESANGVQTWSGGTKCSRSQQHFPFKLTVKTGGVRLGGEAVVCEATEKDEQKDGYTKNFGCTVTDNPQNCTNPGAPKKYTFKLVQKIPKIYYIAITNYTINPLISIGVGKANSNNITYDNGIFTEGMTGESTDFSGAIASWIGDGGYDGSNGRIMWTRYVWSIVAKGALTTGLGTGNIYNKMVASSINNTNNHFNSYPIASNASTPGGNGDSSSDLVTVGQFDTGKYNVNGFSYNSGLTAECYGDVNYTITTPIDWAGVLAFTSTGYKDFTVQDWMQDSLTSLPDSSLYRATCIYARHNYFTAANFGKIDGITAIPTLKTGAKPSTNTIKDGQSKVQGDPLRDPDDNNKIWYVGADGKPTHENTGTPIYSVVNGDYNVGVWDICSADLINGGNGVDGDYASKSNYKFILTDGATFDNGIEDTFTPKFQQTDTWYNGDYGKEDSDKADKLMATYAANLWMWYNNGYASYTGYMNAQNKHDNKLYNYDAWVVGDTLAAGISVGTTAFWQNITASANTYVTSENFLGEAFTGVNQKKSYSYSSLRSGEENINNYIRKDKKFCFGSVFKQSDILYSGYCGGKESSITDRYVVAAGANIFSVGDATNICNTGTCSISSSGAISWDSNGNSVRRYDSDMINDNLKVPLNEVSTNQSGEYWISTPMAIALGEEATASGGDDRGLSEYEVSFGSQHQYQEATGFRVHRGQFCNTKTGSGYNWGYDSRLDNGNMGATNWNDGANGFLPEALSQTFDIMPYRLASQYRYIKYSVLDTQYTDGERTADYSYLNDEDSFYNAFDQIIEYTEKGTKGSIYRVDTNTCKGTGTSSNVMFIAKKMVELTLKNGSTTVATIEPNGTFKIDGTTYASNIPFGNDLTETVTGTIAGKSYQIKCTLGKRDSVASVSIKSPGGRFVRNKITINNVTYDVAATAKYYYYGYNVTTGEFTQPVNITPQNRYTGIDVSCVSVKEATDYAATGLITNLEILETKPNGKYSTNKLYNLFIYRDTVTYARKNGKPKYGSSGPTLDNADVAYKNSVIINTPVSEEYVKILDINNDKAVIQKLHEQGMIDTTNEDKRVDKSKNGTDKSYAADQVSASFITVFVGDTGNFCTGNMASMPNFNSSVGLLSNSTDGKAWNFGTSGAGYQNSVNLRSKYTGTSSPYPNWVLTDYIELDCTVKYYSKNLQKYITVPAGEQLLLADVDDTMCYSSTGRLYTQKLRVNDISSVGMAPIGSCEPLFNGITCSSGTFYQFFICTSSGEIRQQNTDTDNVSFTAVAINDPTTVNDIIAQTGAIKSKGVVSNKLDSYVALKMNSSSTSYPLNEGTDRNAGWNVNDAGTKYIRGSNATSNEGNISSHDGYNISPIVDELGVDCYLHQRASRAYTTAAINIIGRFGDLVLEDTTDPRYASYFKVANAYDSDSDLLDGVAPSVNRYSLSHVLTDSAGMFNGLFGADGGQYNNSMSLNASARVDGSKFSTLPLTAYKLVGVNDKFADAQLTLGYDLYFDVSSIGSFNGDNSAVYAKYYYYEMLVDADGNYRYYPVDVYSEDSKGVIRCIYQFGKDIVSSVVPSGYNLFNDAWITRGDDVNLPCYYDYSTVLDNSSLVGRNITYYVTSINQAPANTIGGVYTLLNSAYESGTTNKVGNVGYNVLSSKTKLLNGSQMLLGAVSNEFLGTPEWSETELANWKNQNSWDMNTQLSAGDFSVGSYKNANNKNTDLEYLKSGQLWSLSIEIPTHFYTVPAGSINPESTADMNSVSTVYKECFGHNRQAGDTTFAYDGKDNWVASYIVVCADIIAKDDMGWTYQYDGTDGNLNTFKLSKSTSGNDYHKPGSGSAEVKCLYGTIDNYISGTALRRAPMLAVWDDNYEYSQAVDLDSYGTH